MADLDAGSSTLQLDALSDDDDVETLRLVVLFDGAATTHVLPAVGEVFVGRGPDCHVRLADGAVSREHVRLRLEAPATVEDLDSGNGTHLNGRRLTPGAATPVGHRDLLELGETLVVVERMRRVARRARLHAHAAFEARLEAACRACNPFTVQRIRISGTADAEAVEAALTTDLGPQDVVAAYAPGEFERLVFGRPETVAGDGRHMQAGLPSAEVRLGAASWPRDGSTPDSLLAAAGARLAGRDGGHEGSVLADPAMRRVYALARRVAEGSISVLVLGETGVGKEVLAEYLHAESPRAAKPFVKLNCAALSETLLESELFGHEKGAFTGAERAKPGLLEVADGGTLFLDELGEMAPATQSKLLRVLEQRQVRRVGGLEARAVDVRFVSATNCDLSEEIRSGRFREDLYYRLEGVTLHVPPLRERPSEIRPLVEHFAERVAIDLGRGDGPLFGPRALELLEAYAWPGNIRELRNVVERALLLATGPTIEPEHLPLEKLQATWQVSPKAAPAAHDEDLEARIEARERARIEAALEACGGNQSRAAEQLGISRRTLSKRLDKYGFARPRKKP